MSGAAAKPPSPERVLQALFWRLMWRGRTLPGAGQWGSNKPRWGNKVNLCLFAFLGILPALAAFFSKPLVFASSLHAFTLLFAALTLASSLGAVLFVREEAEILLHRPVQPGQILRAKSMALVGYSLLLALALNLAGIFTSFFNPGNAPWFFVVHAVTTALLMVWSAALVVLLYNACLQWFGRERLDNLLTLAQVLMSIAMVVGSQLLPRWMAAVEQVDFQSAWVFALPPLWFAALDMVLCGIDVARLWPMALLAVLATVATCWLAFVRLGPAYANGLLALNEFNSPRPSARTTAQERPLRRWLQRAPLRWWLRNPIEREAFCLCIAYMLRDRETKLKVYQGLAPMVVMPVFVAFSPGARSDDGAPPIMMMAFAFSLFAMAPMQELVNLRFSEQHRAAAVFRCAAVPHWAPLFHGMRKAVLLWPTLPAFAVLVGLAGWWFGSLAPVLLAVPVIMAMLLGTLFAGLFGPCLPFSQPSDLKQMHLGCMATILAMGFGVVLSMLGGVSIEYGWYWQYVSVLVVAGAILMHCCTRWIRKMPWQAAED
jgi:hypothetical protein